MSAIIKSGNFAGLSAVRALDTPPPTAIVVHPRVDEERERLRRAIATLEGERNQRDVAIEVLRKDVERAFEEGQAKGHKAGLAEAQDRETDRLKALEAATHAAHATLTADLGSLERLSALLARDCLDIILGNASDRAALVSEIVATQMAKIDKAMLLSIEVSRADFADDAALAALAERTGSATITASTATLPGGCVMTLRLGRMHVGLDQQWGALREVLTDMAMPEAAP
jgi:flagellar biosynthesis/type III secretory pathway protein FliH